MEVLLQSIIIVIVVNFCLKAGFVGNWKGTVAYALFIAVISLLLFPIVIKTDCNVFEKLCTNKNEVSNMVTLLTFEAIVGMIVSIEMLENLYATKKKKWIKSLRFIPGVLIIGVVFYIELLFFKNFAGIDFLWVALFCAVAFMLGVYLLTYIIRVLLPQLSSRYELKFFVCFILLVFSVFMNLGLADYKVSNLENNIEIENMLAFVGIVITGFAIGIVLYKNKKKIKKNG